MSKRYTAEQREFLKTGYLSQNTLDLTKAFNAEFGTEKSENATASFLFKNGYSCGRTGANRFRRSTNNLLTSEQSDFVKKGYQRLKTPELVIALNEKFGLELKESQIKSYCYNHGIKSGRTGQFLKGQRPWNKETTGLLPPNPNSFKKGHIPASVKPLWSERISKDGYIEIKVPVPDPHRGSKTRYVLKHRWVYEQAHGPIPEGKMVSLKNGDPLNCDPGNLMLISRAEMLKLNQNGYKRSHDDLKPCILTLSKLQVVAGEKLKQLSGK